jgi:hypothetical protein
MYDFDAIAIMDKWKWKKIPLIAIIVLNAVYSMLNAWDFFLFQYTQEIW